MRFHNISSGKYVLYCQSACASPKFSKMYPLPNWPDEITNVADRLKRDIVLGDITDAPHSNLLDVLQLSENFPITFPLETARCKVIKEVLSAETLDGYIKSVYPVLHERVLLLYFDFLMHKRRLGNAIERKVYENMTVVGLVDRFLKKRAATFMGKNDDYLLLNNTKGRGNWESIGTDNENGYLTLENCLSYEEIKLSAFLSVSSYTYFVNDGNRSNKGIPAKNRSQIQDSGIIIGLIGARLKKKDVMEYQEIVYSLSQNTENNGYGTVFAPTMNSLMSGFYGKPSLTYRDLLRSKQLKEPGYFTEVSRGVYFDNITYSKRVALSIDTLLFEGNQRANESSKFAYIHVVGIGLGVWKCATHQEELFMETFANRLEYLGPHLHSISDMHFAYFSQSSSCGKYKHGSMVPIPGHPKEGIKVYVSRREPHTKLLEEHEEKLLVVSYAWDGNALPGNEFWLGKLASTGDSAAASATQITELHNAHINKMVCGANLHVATRKGVFHINKYMENVMQESKRRGHGDHEELGGTSKDRQTK